MDKGMESRAGLVEYEHLDSDTFKSICKLRGIKIGVRRIKDEKMGDDLYVWMINNIQDKPIYGYEKYNSATEAKRHAMLELYLLIVKGK
jgi:hypothetical protein